MIKMERALPRVVVAGLAGDSGKTLISLGLVRALRGRGLRVAPFKKGPDFIDAAWLGHGAGVPGRNLDTFLMSEETIRGSVARAALASDVAVVEGNRGLFDGLDAEGSHSTAQLSRIIDAPVVLVIDVTKMTRTVAALVLGCQALDPELKLRGVVLNRVGTARQERVIRDALSQATDLPVLGAIPRLSSQHLPGRHLGLVTAEEHPEREETIEAAAEAVKAHVDLDELLTVADEAGTLELPKDQSGRKVRPSGPAVRIGVDP